MGPRLCIRPGRRWCSVPFQRMSSLHIDITVLLRIKRVWMNLSTLSLPSILLPEHLLLGRGIRIILRGQERQWDSISIAAHLHRIIVRLQEVPCEVDQRVQKTEFVYWDVWPLVLTSAG